MLEFNNSTEELIFNLIDKIIEKESKNNGFIYQAFIQFSKAGDKHYKITIGHKGEIQLILTREFYDNLAVWFKSIYFSHAEQFFLIKTKKECENEEHQP